MRRQWGFHARMSVEVYGDLKNASSVKPRGHWANLF